MVILESYCAGLLFCVRSAAVEVKDMSEKKVEDVNQRCADVLVWLSFSPQCRQVSNVLRMGCSIYISRGVGQA